MNLHKLIRITLLACILCLVVPAFAGMDKPASGVEIPKEVRARQIESRLLEIKKMDRSALSSSEKKELRREVKSLKREARHNGIYLSVGAIIIIALLLIILF